MSTADAKPARSSRTGRRRWVADGVPSYELIEVQQLGELILRRIDADPAYGLAVYGPWVASRVTFPLRSLLLQASRNTRGAILLNLLVVAGGFATSGIAVATKAGGKSSSLTSWVVFTIGLIIAMGGAITQFFRPAFRATERTSLAVELREEGWAFATASGAYTGAVTEALAAFQAKVSDVHRRAARVAALDSTTPPAAHATGRSQPRRNKPESAPPPSPP
ncbi:MAG: DUF4231 domain-containing protein [Solirubrobacteraceae bacterium]